MGFAATRFSPVSGALRGDWPLFLRFRPLLGFGPWAAQPDFGSRGWGFEFSWAHYTLALFHDAVLEHERRNALFLKPAGHGVAFVIDGQRDERAARGDDDAGPRGLGAVRQEDRQGRGYDVKDHRSERGVLYYLLLLGPLLGSHRHPWPNVQGLPGGAPSHEHRERD